jgi:methylglutamate dehydrogenase subunit D
MADATTSPVQSPLAGNIAPGRKGRRSGAPGVIVQEIRPAGVATLIVRQGQAEALAAIFRADLGCELPIEPWRADGAGLSIVWAGPGRWLAMAAAGDGRSIAGLPSRLAGIASVIDQGHALALLRLSGPRIRDTLAKGFPIDLHPRAFAPGDTAITSVSHITAHIWQTGADPVYEVAIARSLTLSFWHWLEAAAAEYGLEVEGTADAHRTA